MAIEYEDSPAGKDKALRDIHQLADDSYTGKYNGNASELAEEILKITEKFFGKYADISDKELVAEALRRGLLG